MPGFSVENIERIAIEELREESHRAAVEAAKIRIREAMKRKRWWHTFFPFTFKFTIERLPNV